MRKLFPHGKTPAILVAESLPRFWDEFAEDCVKARLNFRVAPVSDGLYEELTRHVESVLDPFTGGEKTHGMRWFHNPDIHGDGVRSFSVAEKDLPVSAIAELHDALVERFQDYTVLLRVYAPSIVDDGNLRDCISLKAHQMRLTRAIAQRWLCVG